MELNEPGPSDFASGRDQFPMSGRRARIVLPHGVLQLPAFLPDATHGAVRALDATDIERCGIEALQTNVFHIMQRPGSSVIRAMGGLHPFLSWKGPLVTDSGGFQVYSLIRENPRNGRLTSGGLIYQPQPDSRKVTLTPEKSVQLQLAYGSDIVICLDDCTSADEPKVAQQEAVQRTVAWARKCAQVFLQYQDRRRDALMPRPLLFAVVQGGNDFELRKQCAEELLEIGFDGYGLGGWPLDTHGKLLLDMIAYTRQLIPVEFPMHALGIGHPDSVVACASLGYGLFDSTMPTRDARHGRLYVFNELPAATSLQGRWYSKLYIQDEQHVRARRPISELCDCLCCARYTRAYLHHLFKIGDSLYQRLATIHNLRFMVQLVDRLRHLG